MFTHEEIWRGIDRLAAHAQTSPSGLARRAGLDSTTFNPSKRVSRDGTKPRWPSTESLAKALSAAHMDFAGFAALVSGRKTPSIEMRALAESGAEGVFDAGVRPAGAGWTRIPLPELSFENAFALIVEGDAMEPVYRAGDRLVVTPDDPPRRGDRVVVRQHSGAIQAWQLGESGVQSVSLSSLNPMRPDAVLPLKDIDWLARIAWASQ